MTETISFFDVDHTLTRHSTGLHFAREAVRRGVLDAKRLAALPFLYLSYRLGRLKPESLEEGIKALAGIPREVLEEIAREAFQKRILPDLNPGVAEHLAGVKSGGGLIVLATSSFDLIVRPLAEYLGVDRVLASSFEFVEGVTTGRFSGRMVFGKAKLEAAARAAEGEGLDLVDCAFYSDSVHDLPLLLAAGRPVAVHPDRRLARVARARGWEIRSFR